VPFIERRHTEIVELDGTDLNCQQETIINEDSILFYNDHNELKAKKRREENK